MLEITFVFSVIIITLIGIFLITLRKDDLELAQERLQAFKEEHGRLPTRDEARAFIPALIDWPTTRKEQEEVAAEDPERMFIIYDELSGKLSWRPIVDEAEWTYADDLWEQNKNGYGL